MVIKGNKLLKNKKKNKKIKLPKLPILILSETEKENYYLIEIQKSYEKIKKGDSFIINGELLFETSETIWKNLL